MTSINGRESFATHFEHEEQRVANDEGEDEVLEGSGGDEAPNVELGPLGDLGHVQLDGPRVDGEEDARLLVLVHVVLRKEGAKLN